MAVCRYKCTADTSQETAEANRGEAVSLHERLVAYVHTLELGSRRGVWGEHSYARGERGAGEARRSARVLLAPRVPPPASPLIDVLSPGSAPPSPPALGAPPAAPPAPADDDEPADAHEWEARVAALAPTRVHAQLADAVASVLRRMRLERLVSGGGLRARGEARAAAARLRRALAPAWLAGGGGAAPWLHAALAAYLPRSVRRLYEEALGELRRAVPRLAERLTSEWAPPPPEPPRGVGPPVGPDSDPWLVWVSSGCAALDARWERRLAGLVHTRVLRAPAAAAAAPEAWSAGAAGAVRAQLTDALAEAGDRSIILGGLGAGASLCLLLARGAGGAGAAAGGVRGAVLAAPALRTAEGGRGARDDALHAVRLPLLLLVGTHAHDCSRSIANDVCERSGAGGAGGAGPRRVLEVRGADAQLRLSRRQRMRMALPQHALDAALVEECVRWAIETAEGEESPAPPPPPPRRHPLPTIVHQIDLDGPEEEYAHLPQASAAAAAAAAAAASAHSTPAQSARSIEIVGTLHKVPGVVVVPEEETGVDPTAAAGARGPFRPPRYIANQGRVVSRAAGGTPLQLLPPRRSTPPSPALPSAADIMQMPIVFADDNATDSNSTGSPVTVTSGKARGSSVTPPVKMTRVILAKRGGTSGAGAARGPGGSGAGAARGQGGGVVPRRLLVRRGVRLVPRRDEP